MNSNYPLSREITQFVETSERFFPAEVVAQGIEAQRQAYNAMAEHFSPPRPEGLKVSDECLKGVPVRRYQPEGGRAGPRMLFAHGGGWYLGGLDSHDSFCAQLAHDCQQEVIAVDYRLAPEAPYPAGLDDLTEVYQAVLQSDAQPPVLVGDSAGANLMAALTLRCSRLGLPAAGGQVLIYPALASPGSQTTHQTLADAPLLDRAGLEFCWRNYVQGIELIGPAREEVVPLNADLFEGLPPSVILAAQFDPLVDDAHAYSEQLSAAGIQCRYREIAGLVHGGLRAVGQAEEADELYRLICEGVRWLVDCPPNDRRSEQ